MLLIGSALKPLLQNKAVCCYVDLTFCVCNSGLSKRPKIGIRLTGPDEESARGSVAIIYRINANCSDCPPRTRRLRVLYDGWRALLDIPRARKGLKYRSSLETNTTIVLVHVR